MCLFSSRAFTRSIAAGVSATGAFLCRRRRDRGDGAVEAGEGEKVDGVVASLLEAEAASAANDLKRQPLAEPPPLLQLPPLVETVRADARRASRILAVVPPPLMLPHETTAERSAAISRFAPSAFFFFFLRQRKKKWTRGVPGSPHLAQFPFSPPPSVFLLFPFLRACSSPRFKPSTVQIRACASEASLCSWRPCVLPSPKRRR